MKEIDTLTDLYYEIEETEWRKVTLWVKANSEKFLIQAEINDYSNWRCTFKIIIEKGIENNHDLYTLCLTQVEY